MGENGSVEIPWDKWNFISKYTCSSATLDFRVCWHRHRGGQGISLAWKKLKNYSFRIYIPPRKLWRAGVVHDFAWDQGRSEGGREGGRLADKLAVNVRKSPRGKMLLCKTRGKWDVGWLTVASTSRPRPALLTCVFDIARNLLAREFWPSAYR